MRCACIVCRVDRHAIGRSHCMHSPATAVCLAQGRLTVGQQNIHANPRRKHDSAQHELVCAFVPAVSSEIRPCCALQDTSPGCPAGPHFVWGSRRSKDVSLWPHDDPHSHSLPASHRPVNKGQNVACVLCSFSILLSAPALNSCSPVQVDALQQPCAAVQA